MIQLYVYQEMKNATCIAIFIKVIIPLKFARPSFMILCFLDQLKYKFYTVYKTQYVMVTVIHLVWREPFKNIGQMVKWKWNIYCLKTVLLKGSVLVLTIHTFFNTLEGDFGHIFSLKIWIGIHFRCTTQWWIEACTIHRL